MGCFFVKVELALHFLSLPGPKRILRLTFLNNSQGASAQGRQWFCAGDAAVSPNCRVSQCLEGMGQRHILGKLLWEGSRFCEDQRWGLAPAFPEPDSWSRLQMELSCSSHSLAAPAEPWWLFNAHLGNPPGTKSSICSHLKTIFC